MHQPGVSRHLEVLRDAHLVEVRRDAPAVRVQNFFVSSGVVHHILWRR